MSGIEAKKILVIGSGGREHAIAWKLAQHNHTVFVAPGNAGTSEVGTNISVGVDETDLLRRFASDNKIDVTVVGPEAPLAAGIVDAFNEDKLPIFGPTQEAAKLESDKAWAVEFMERHNIPHPDSKIFRTHEYDKAVEYVHDVDPKKIVIKPAGLTGGKGVTLPDSRQEALNTLKEMEGNTIVIQKRLEGQEVSLMAVSDGITAVSFLPVQDHKRIYDGDTGPNTGGMGAYAPIPWVTPAMVQEMYETGLEPAVEGMVKEGVPFKGVLYGQFMLTGDGLQVVEYNVRFGDPEAQALMMLLDSDLAQLLLASVRAELSSRLIKFRPGFAVCVVFAPAGYPGDSEIGQEIFGLPLKEKDPDVEIFHAGTLMKQGRLVTNGGRVLGVTARAKTLEGAIEAAYHAVDQISFEGMKFRRDIGRRGLEGHG